MSKKRTDKHKETDLSGVSAESHAAVDGDLNSGGD